MPENRYGGTENRQANHEAIFVHSLFRSGSTYLFQVFRRSPAGYWCYQEPLHELATRKEKDLLLAQDSDRLAHWLRHPQLERPYFSELVDAFAGWKDLDFTKSCYQRYFQPDDPDLVAYFSALLSAARGRPFIQECRTCHRIGLLKKALGGVHVYLCRNPWDQWWSYKADDYFGAGNLMILAGDNPPLPFERLRGRLDLRCPSGGSLFDRFARCHEIRLSPENSYRLFFLLWCFAWREAAAQADLFLNIDRMAADGEYRAAVRMQLEDRGVAGLDFEDCAITRNKFGEGDRRFFEPVENDVFDALASAGWSAPEMERLREFRTAVTADTGGTAMTAPGSFGRSGEERFREIVLRNEGREARSFAASEAALAEIRSREAALGILLEASRTELERTRKSFSWRCTAPLRWVRALAARLCAPGSTR